ncbi:MAG TPA: ABC transporter permease [Vicinamibacterales bacterium]|nr:ABC transporter permease [Vicinamibacterales bacterium]
MLRQDVRYAFRSLVKSPGFTAVAVACLALGIGVNATIFSVIDGVILRPYPYPEPERIIVVHARNHEQRISRGTLSYADFKDIRDSSSTIASIAAFANRSLTISDGRGEPERFSGATVSWNLFGLLGMRPVAGRDFMPDDDKPGAEPVVLLSHELWELRYQKDAAIVGRAIMVNGKPHTIIGVMPERFLFPENERLWVTIAPYQDATPRDARGAIHSVFARLKPGVSQQQAESELSGIAARLATAYPRENAGWSVTTRTLGEWMLPQQVELVLLTMMGAVTLVLLIACANVANLLLARASVRQREISIRLALGAGRWRIVRQLLTEAVMIGCISGPLGAAIAWIGVRLVDGAMPPDQVPYFISWSLNARSLAYTTAISLLTGLVFGLAPAMQALRTNLQSSLKDGGRGHAGGSRARLRNTLVISEVALSLVLLVGASLFVRSFLNLQGAAVGFDTGPLMSMRFYLPGAAYEPAEAKARRVEDIVRRVESLPGVQAAFASNFVPMGAGGGGGRVIVEGNAVEPGREPGIELIGVTPHMRQTLDVALVAGRDMSNAEGATRTPVALVNQAMAQRLWPGSDPVGRRFHLVDGSTQDWFTVIGIVADFRHRQGGDTEPQEPAAYVPYPFETTLNTGLTIRVAGDPAQITSAVREQLRLSDPTLPMFAVTTVEELRRLSYWQYGLFGSMFATFGFIALVLASIGVYGVLSYSVSQRVQEIGVRLALGAGRHDVLRLIVGQGLRLAAWGIAGGLVGAAAVTWIIQSILYNVTPTDPVSFGGVALFLTIIAALASYLPARRAMAVDPIVALRND